MYFKHHSFFLVKYFVVLQAFVHIHCIHRLNMELDL
jgi:hypothetical protein